MDAPRMRALAGFTLIELMTAITLFAILSLLAMPMYTSFIGNSQIRTAAESMAAGLRLAQTEAIKRNGNVEFILDPSQGWQVNDVTDTDKLEFIGKAAFDEGASKAKVVPSGDPRRAAFNGLGRILQQSPVDGSPPMTQIDVTTKFDSYSNERDLRVLIGTGAIRVCDPKLGATDPAGCP